MELSQRKSYRKRYQRNSIKIMKETAPAAFNNRRSVESRYGLKPSQSNSLLLPHNSNTMGSVTSSRSMDNLALNVNKLRTPQGTSPRMTTRGTCRTSNSDNYSDSDNSISTSRVVSDIIANSSSPR